MIKLSQYILESMNNPYPHTKTRQSKNLTRYAFSDADGKSFGVEIHHRMAGRAEVAFDDEDGRLSATGDVGHKSMRVFSTIKDIMKKHAAEHGVDQYMFSSIKAGKGHESRERLYKTIAKKHGGSSEEGMFTTSYRIPVRANARS